MPPTIVEVKLEDILAKIDSRLENIENGLTDLKISQVEIKGEIKALDEKLSGQVKTLDEKLSGQVKTLDEKVTGIGKRLENQEFLNRGILAALIVALIAGAAKLFGWLPTS
jgi:chromosome segregation ATPase